MPLPSTPPRRPRRAGRWRLHPDLAYPVATFLGTRAALALVVWAGQVLLPLSAAPGAWLAYPRGLLLDGWVRWDSGWYLLVAQHGY